MNTAHPTFPLDSDVKLYSLGFEGLVERKMRLCRLGYPPPHAIRASLRKHISRCLPSPYTFAPFPPRQVSVRRAGTRRGDEGREERVLGIGTMGRGGEERGTCVCVCVCVCWGCKSGTVASRDQMFLKSLIYCITSTSLPLPPPPPPPLLLPPLLLPPLLLSLSLLPLLWDSIYSRLSVFFLRNSTICQDNVAFPYHCLRKHDKVREGCT